MGWVASLGTQFSSATGTTLVISVAAAVPIGDLVVVAGGANATNVSGITDSKGNTYTLDKTASAGSSAPQITLGSSVLTVALTTSDTITVTFAASKGGRVAAAEQYTNVPASPVDAAASGTGNGTSTGVTLAGAGATAQASEIVVMAVINAATVAPSATAPLTMRDTVASSGTVRQLGIGDDTLSGIATPSEAMTWTGSVAYAAVLVPYKLVAAAPADPPTPEAILLQGVGRAAVM